MNSATFSEWLDNALAETKSKLDSKASEYATLDNRFKNFDVSADLLRCTPIEAAYAFMTKHITSIYEWYATGYIPTEEQAREKLGDVRNYCYIIEAMYKAKNDEPNYEEEPPAEEEVWQGTWNGYKIYPLNPLPLTENDWIDKIPRPNEVTCGDSVVPAPKGMEIGTNWFTSSIFRAGVLTYPGVTTKPPVTEEVYQNGILEAGILDDLDSQS